ncbi:hypothetical protein [Denitromonas halophila]|uniref:hypothetical protein n=1 Tax=Denitromonas halophila TaxID=1629404 RepID=UPI0016423B12|nr:hypothetical protein [Denitromonas halophila]
MKDSIALLLTALVAATIAWAFWFLAGPNGFDAIMLAALIYLAIDNFRLRKRLRSKQSD